MKISLGQGTILLEKGVMGYDTAKARTSEEAQEDKWVGGRSN